MQILSSLSSFLPHDNGCCHCPGVREMGGEAVQDILIHLDVILRPTCWERSSPFSGHHKALQVLLLPGACGAPASVFFTCSQGNLQHFGTISPNNPVTLPFHPGIRGLRIPQLGWGFLNLSMTPSSSTLISREENSLQSREVAEGMSPRAFSLCGGCIARAQV